MHHMPRMGLSSLMVHQSISLWPILQYPSVTYIIDSCVYVQSTKQCCNNKSCGIKLISRVEEIGICMTGVHVYYYVNKHDTSSG